MTNNQLTEEELQTLIIELQQTAYRLNGTNSAYLMSDAIKPLRELQERRKAAMDSESWCLPLDYLQGHKDGLEWASQLAEANHPETGDWLYDDPIELAKAIRKGPDMPPVQPVADREPDHNPVLAYADSYRDMAKQGVESVPIWSVITDLERNIAPLYRHAQPVPVVPYDFDFDRFNDVVWLECVASNPHMHSPTTSIIARVALELNKRILAGNSPVIPEGYVMVPKELSCEMDDASWEAYHNTRCMSDIWDALLSLAPQLPGSEPATVPGKWIPVSEQLPDPKSAQRVCVYTPTPHEDMRYRFVPASLFRAVCSDATHWYYMGPPAAPQEPKP